MSANTDTQSDDLTLRDIVEMDADERKALSDDQILGALPEPLADIGGGEEYYPEQHSPTGSSRVTATEADHVAGSVDELERAGDALAEGDTLYIEPGHYEFGNDVAESLIVESPDVTIASGGADGRAVLRHTGTWGARHGIHIKADNVRVTGLQIDRNEIGTWATREEWDEADTDYSYEEYKMYDKMREQGVDEQTRHELLEKGDAVYEIGATDGIVVEGANCEIDDCVIRGCVHSAIQVRRGEGEWNVDQNTRIHHNRLVDNAGPSLGYGVVVKSGHPIIERNFTNRCRHHISGDGDRDCGYDLVENLLGPESTSHVIDMHEDAKDDDGNWRGGHFCNILRNVVLYDETCIKWRATPWDSHEVAIESNWLFSETQRGTSGQPGDGIFQMHRRGGVGFQQMKTKNNSHGARTPNEKTGPEGLFAEDAPRDGDGKDEDDGEAGGGDGGGGKDDDSETPPPKDRPEAPDREADKRDMWAILDLLRRIFNRGS